MSEPIKNIVLVGRTGNGKSSTGNTLIGDKLFKTKNQAVGVTMKCQMHRVAVQDGPIINVIDTPGLFDSAVFEDLSKEIINCLTMAEEGIHAVLLVLSVRARVSQEEESTLNTLQCIFDSKILDYFIVVFTGGDDLEEQNETLVDYFGAGCPEYLTNALRLCGGRKVLFNNRTTDKEKKAEQLKQLMALVSDVEKQTGGIPYTYQMHRKIKEENERVKEQAELEAVQEKKRMEEEKNKELVALAEEKEKMREQKMANESKEAELAMMQAKIRMEEENNKQVAALAEEKEKVREQKMANESKEAELAAMQDKLQMEEKLRMEEEENKQLAALTEENEKLREQNMVIESKFLAEAELEVLQVKFQMEQEKNKQLIALVEEESRLKEQHRNEPKKTGVVYARNLCIEWGQDSRYWSWVTLQYDISSNALVEAAALLGVCWLDVGGTFDTRELTPWTHYEVVFVMKLRKSASGWEVPVHMKLVMPNSMPGPEERIVKLKDYIGKGWVTILAGEFLTTPEYLGEIRFSMYETNRWQEGLIIKGVIIRPKN